MKSLRETATERHDRPPEKTSGGRPEPVRIRLLGGFSVSVGERSFGEDECRLRKAGSLLKLLALTPGHRLPRERVMDLLWPDSDPKAAANNLYYALHVARKTLGSAADSSARYLTLRAGWLALCPDGPLWVDVEAFEEAARAARRAREPAAYRAALDLYAGDLLPQDPYEEWAEGSRIGLRGLYLGLLVEVAGLYEERGQSGAAVEVLQRLVVEEPAREEAHAGLMRLYAANGQRGRALEQYGRLRDALRQEPGTDTELLYREIRAGRVVEPEAASPENPADTPRHNLPIERTSFVGRERELLELKRDLAMTRLLTLTGAGGSGKTRLALEVARDLLWVYPDGVWFAELAPLSDPALVPRAVASALDVHEQPGRPLTDTLADALREKEILLLLDNCEHLVDGAALLVDTLLDASPTLRVLATSREPLGVAGEINHPVPPLSLPETGRPLSTGELEGSEAARLFVERALYRPSAFVLTEENSRAVAEICRRLDGMPLAIELAAARVGALAVEQISARLSDSLGLLTGGSRTAPPRQQTLRGTLDWGHELLPEPERELFRRLSVFAGGWSLEAAGAVGVGGGVEEEEVLDLLSRLVDKSLVVAGTSLGTEGALRYRMLEPVRQYAREKLEESGEAGETGRRHALWYLALAEEAEEGLSGPDQPLWLGYLETEHDNLRTALDWSLSRPDGYETGLRLAAALWLFWDTHGHLAEGRGWLQKVISTTGAKTRTRAAALNGAGWIVISQGEYEAAIPLLEESLAIYRELEDKEGIAAALTNLGLATLFGMRDDPPLGPLLEEVLGLRPELEDHRTIGKLLIFAGMIVEGPEEGRQGVTLHEESLTLFREVKDIWGMSTCLTSLGIMALRRGEHARAASSLSELLHLSRGLDKKVCIAYSFFGLASLAARQDQTLRAARLWGASESVREAAGIRLSPLARSATDYESLMGAVRTGLGETGFAQAWKRGRAMTQEEAIEYALSPDTGPEASPNKPATAPQSDPLTRREWEVAVLAAEGLTNRQIASRLSISEHTAATHVRRILGKLDLASRVQLAAWAVERLQRPDSD